MEKGQPGYAPTVIIPLLTRTMCMSIQSLSMLGHMATIASSVIKRVPVKMLLEFITLGITTTSNQNIRKFFVPGSIRDAIKEYLVKLGEGHWGCSGCEFTSNRASSVSVHVEAKHLYTEGFYCNICNKHCPTRNSLNIHKFRYHKP